MMYLASFVTLTVLVHDVWGYASGAPSRQCDRMYPGHGLAAQIGPAPYAITLSQKTFSCPGEVITVTVSGSTTFRGFLCEPRPNPEVYATSGVLSSDAADGVSKQDQCGNGKSLTHANKEDKTSITFKWRPTTADNVYIVCTIVGRYRTFWVKLRSEAMTFVRTECAQTSGTGSTGTGSGGGPNTATGGASSGGVNSSRSETPTDGGGATSNADMSSTNTNDQSQGSTGTNSGSNTVNQPESTNNDTGTNGAGSTNQGSATTNVNNVNDTNNTTNNNTDGNGKNAGLNVSPSAQFVIWVVFATLSLLY